MSSAFEEDEGGQHLEDRNVLLFVHFLPIQIVRANPVELARVSQFDIGLRDSPLWRRLTGHWGIPCG